MKEHFGVIVDGTKNIPGTMPTSSTAMFSKNVFNFVENLVADGKISLNLDDEIIRDHGDQGRQDRPCRNLGIHAFKEKSKCGSSSGLSLCGAALLGYKLISEVPSLIHTPLMSGMNALSGITVVGALTATGLAWPQAASWLALQPLSWP